jgi:hypothetical protein
MCQPWLLLHPGSQTHIPTVYFESTWNVWILGLMTCTIFLQQRILETSRRSTFGEWNGLADTWHSSSHQYYSGSRNLVWGIYRPALCKQLIKLNLAASSKYLFLQCTDCEICVTARHGTKKFACNCHIRSTAHQSSWTLQQRHAYGHFTESGLHSLGKFHTYQTKGKIGTTPDPWKVNKDYAPIQISWLGNV